MKIEIGPDVRRWLFRYPIPLTPNRVYRPYLGGMLLDRFRGKEYPKDDFHPEDWVGSTTPSILGRDGAAEGLSEVKLPDGRMVHLRDLVASYPTEMLGASHCRQFGEELGILVKLLDSAIRLPLQGHPDRAFARQYLNSPYGKTEAWIVLDTREIEGEKPYVLLGFKEQVSQKELLGLVKRGKEEKLIERMNRLEVSPGDVYLLRSGMPHAVGPGVFMIEVQEPTDWVVCLETTCAGVALDDSVLHMNLGWETGLRIFDRDDNFGTSAIRKARQETEVVLRKVGNCETRLLPVAENDFFQAHRLEVLTRFEPSYVDRCEINIVSQGRGQIQVGKSKFDIKAGDTYFVPAAASGLVFISGADTPLVIYRCFPPPAV